MAIPFLTSTEVSVTLPLACDLVVQAANPEGPDGAAPIMRYLETSDDEGLIVPEGASMVTVRALSRTEMEQAERAAGRYRHCDAQLYARTFEQVVEARVAGAVAPLLEAVDGLSDEEYSAYQRHAEWARRRNTELVRRGLLVISDRPDWAPGPRGFPVEDLERESLVGPELIWEIAQHIQNVSLLGKAPRQSCGPSYGPPPGPTSAATTSAPLAPPATDGSAPSPGPSCAAEC